MHGASEAPGNTPIKSRGNMKGMFAVDGLKRGNTFGFIGGSDAHGLLWHHGIGRRLDPWACGLTGVLSADASREALWDAMYARRTVATSGHRPDLSVTIAGHPPGSEVTLQQPPTLTVTLPEQAEGSTLFIIRDGQEVHSQPGQAQQSWTDPQAEPGKHSYYVRLVRTPSGAAPEVTWTSPVFVTLEPTSQTEP